MSRSTRTGRRDGARVSAVSVPPRRSARVRAQKPFRLFDLPLELRWRIYSHMMPSGGRIVMDPQYIYHPLPYSAHPCEDAINMMRMSRHVYAEVSEFLYSSNTITMISPSTASMTQSSGLRGPPGPWIRTLELHSTLDRDYGAEVVRVVEHLPNLQTLFIVLYHNMRWHKVFAAVAERAHAENNTDLRLDLDLYTSVVARADRRWQPGKAVKRVEKALDTAAHDLRTRDCSWRRLPARLERVVVTASTTRETTLELLAWRGRADMSRYFKQLSYQKGPPEMTRVTWAVRYRP